ncbi:hypothetical protein F5884DRAFT_56573 [Xylogone sp. PMI_703]|nr:hypothetical protein F5884DRAFT_56573 [Xylogone sp. PMI_703]
MYIRSAHILLVHLTLSLHCRTKDILIAHNVAVKVSHNLRELVTNDNLIFFTSDGSMRAVCWTERPMGVDFRFKVPNHEFQSGIQQLITQQRNSTVQVEAAAEHDIAMEIT